MRQPNPWSLTGLFGPKNLHCAWECRGPQHLLGCWHGHHCLGHFSLEAKPKNHNECASACGDPQGGQEAEPHPEGVAGPLHPLKCKGLWAVGLRLPRDSQGKDGVQFAPWKGCLCLKKQQRGLCQLPLVFLIHGREGSRTASSTGIIPGAAWGGWVMAPHVCCG